MTTDPIFPHGTSYVDRLPTRQVRVWVRKVERLMKAGDKRTPQGILEGLGMDGDHQRQVLHAMERDS